MQSAGGWLDQSQIKQKSLNTLEKMGRAARHYLTLNPFADLGELDLAFVKFGEKKYK